MASTCVRVFIACAAWVVVGCGSAEGGEPQGTGGAPGTGGTGNVPSNCVDSDPIDPTALIDDFEDGNPTLAPIGGRLGDWWISTDDTPGGTIVPSPGAATPERVPGGRCDSVYAMRITGSGFTDWGAVLSVGLRWDDALAPNGNVPVDLSAYRGVKFWARGGELNTSVVRIGIHDTVSHPNAGVCDVSTMAVGTSCWDSFGTDVVPLGETWRQYEIHFDRLSQREFGVPGAALDVANVYVFDWGLGPGIIDFWLDDVRLFD
jgi:hypothetical protein